MGVTFFAESTTGSDSFGDKRISASKCLSDSFSLSCEDFELKNSFFHLIILKSQCTNEAKKSIFLVGVSFHCISS